eukprot:8085888-Pyramimonas_sp.AAC.1
MRQGLDLGVVKTEFEANAPSVGSCCSSSGGAWPLPVSIVSCLLRRQGRFDQVQPRLARAGRAARAGAPLAAGGRRRLQPLPLRAPPIRLLRAFGRMYTGPFGADPLRQEDLVPHRLFPNLQALPRACAGARGLRAVPPSAPAGP